MCELRSGIAFQFGSRGLLARGATLVGVLQESRVVCIARLPGATLHPQPPLHPSKYLAEWCRIVEEWRLFQRGRDGALLLGMADPVPSCQMALPRVRVSRRGRGGLSGRKMGYVVARFPEERSETSASLK